MTTKLYIPVSELREGDKIGMFEVVRLSSIKWGREPFMPVLLTKRNSACWCSVDETQSLIDAFGVDREVEYEEVGRVTIKRAHRTHGQWLVDGVNSDHWWKENVQYGDILTLQRPKV